jgi:Amylo-alpha-1,6-glucosidase
VWSSHFVPCGTARRERSWSRSQRTGQSAACPDAPAHQHVNRGILPNRFTEFLPTLKSILLLPTVHSAASTSRSGTKKPLVFTTLFLMIRKTSPCGRFKFLCLSLMYPMLSKERARAVVKAVERDLFTPYGLLSLSPSNSRYRGQTKAIRSRETVRIIRDRSGQGYSRRSSTRISK